LIFMQAEIAALRRADPAAVAAAIGIAGALTIIGFFFFEFGLGLRPCPLCLEQRIAFYICVPLAGMLWLGAHYDAARKVMLLGFFAVTAFMLWNAGLGAYHAGVEWKFWPGPTDCSGPLDDLGSGGGLLDQIQKIRVVRCDQAAWRFLGLSLAGWNVLVSLGLAALGLWGARGALARPADSR
jgi:disulfide bond formation protein DsbB